MRRERIGVWSLSVLVVALWLGGASGAWGQVDVSPFNGAQEGRVVALPPREFGVEDVSVLNIGPCDLSVIDVSTVANNRDCTKVMPANSTGSLILGANVHLPAGVLITEVSIDYVDNLSSLN